MALLKLVFCLTCLFFGKMAQETGREISSTLRQKRSFISADVGKNVTLQCFYGGTNYGWLFWYKQTLGQEPKLISTFYVFDTRKTFYHEFKDNPRFSLDAGNGKNHLMISDLKMYDSATYYCADYMYDIRFTEGTVVSVQGSGLKDRASVHQSESQIIQPGGSVTLNCTVQTGTCDGGHSVYWFRDSEESHPGLIYTHGDRNDQCERKPNTQTHTCVYNLLMTNLNRSHTGTYYCAVASCGHIRFGNGTKLDIEDEISAVHLLSGALGFTTILTILLIFSVCVISMRGSCLHTESSGKCSDPTFLRQNKINRLQRLKNDTWRECVYFSVKKYS